MVGKIEEATIIHLRRDHTRVVHFILDQLLPPIIRDSRIFCWFAFKILFGRQANLFLDFKDRVSRSEQEDLNKLYREINSHCIDRPTDLNEECLALISGEIIGNKVLEVGVGRMFLAKKLAKNFRVTAVDVDLSDAYRANDHENIHLVESPITNLPFGDKEFETVICTHTLEHVIDFAASFASLRRVASRRLIVVVPMQRPYKYTFDTHLHFFPSIFSFLMATQPKGKYQCKSIGGDIFYMEDY